jgi:tetratricopeptide (TPR) repeat protein
VVRIALARDRRERFGDLGQLREAVDALRPADDETERHTLAAIATRGEKAGMAPDVSRAALTKLIEHVGQLGRQMEAVRSGMADLQRDQRDLLARVAVLESRGESAAAPAIPRPRSGVLLSVLTGMGSAAFAVLLIAAIALKVPRLSGVARLWTAIPAAASAATPARSATASPAPAPSAPAATIAASAPAAAPAPAVQTAAPSPAPSNTPAAATPASTTGAPTTVATAAPEAHRTAQAPETPPAAKPSQAEMARAVAEEHVKRGDQELERGRYDPAAEEFQLALANDPTLAVAWRGLGIAHLMRHNEESARKAYARYLQLAPSAPDARDIRKAIAELNARAKIGSAEK